MSAALPVSVVYVTRNRIDELSRSLTRLAELNPPPAEVLVVDNASTDDTLGYLTQRHPEIRRLAQEKNLGVARARNLGVEAAAHECVVCIDDDALLATDDALRRVVECFDSSPEIALLAFRIVNASRGVTLSHEFPRRRLRERDVGRAGDVAYFIGCGFAVRRSVFLGLGGFCSLIHYGLEELDLSYAVLERGERLFYQPAIVVEHLADPDARRGEEWHFHLMRSRVVVALRKLPLPVAALHLGVWHVGLLGYGLLHGHGAAVLRGAVAGWRLAPRAWRERNPISWRTARRVLALSGRLFS